MSNPAWIRCEDCGEWFCLIHGEHAAECDCLPVDELDFDPYSEGGPDPGSKENENSGRIAVDGTEDGR